MAPWTIASFTMKVGCRGPKSEWMAQVSEIVWYNAGVSMQRGYGTVIHADYVTAKKEVGVNDNG